MELESPELIVIKIRVVTTAQYPSQKVSLQLWNKKLALYQCLVRIILAGESIQSITITYLDCIVLPLSIYPPGNSRDHILGAVLAPN